MKFVIAGGSGVLGQRLAKQFESKGHDVIVLTRQQSLTRYGTSVQWDAKTVGEWQQHLRDAAIINLASQLVDIRPTIANIDLLRRSRVDATLVLKQAMANNGWVAPLWLQMSTLAIYGDCGDEVLGELSAPVVPLPQMTGVAEAWEQAFVGAPAKRGVVMRTGIVLDNATPAMQKLVSITKACLGGRIARGDQWISWIHIDDFILAVQHIIDTAELSGVVHITSPNPVRNRDLMMALRHKLHRPPVPPIPTLAIKVGAFLMGSDPALALTGRRCVPSVLMNSGFEFQRSTIDDALSNLLTQPTKKSLPSRRALSPQEREAALQRAVISAFNYREIGDTKAKMPDGYTHDEFAKGIGTGRDLFERCAAQLDAWSIQRTVGFDVISSSPGVEVGESAVLTMRVVGLHFAAACRVVYVVREPNRHGFAYGTLSGHPEKGEEYFGVTIDAEDQVRFVLRAFSRPNTIFAKLGGPITRRLQLAAQYRYLRAMKELGQSGNLSAGH